MSLVCVPIMVDDVESALADAESARTHGADLVEFRIDRLLDEPESEVALASAVRLVDGSSLPCIVTCRIASEGGEYHGDDARRAALWERIGAPGHASGGCDRPRRPARYIDVEHSAFMRSAGLLRRAGLATEPAGDDEGRASLILSAHDFDGRPARLTSIVRQMCAAPGVSAVKVAWRARSLRDNIEAFELVSSAEKPMIALCMGEFGLMSRVLAPKFGALLTFAPLRESGATAPGQPTIRELLDLYRFRSIGPGTALYGVVGWPVGHSISPRVHNAGFEALARDAVYLPMPVPPEWEHFKATVLAMLDFTRLGLRGLSVTIPHKEHLVRLAREDRSRRWSLDGLSQRCGAANTLVVREDGGCEVINTDGPAAVGALRPALGEVAGRRIAVLGAGGAARSIVFALAEAGARVEVFNRTAARGADLADEASAAFSPWESLASARRDAFVNCTPIGMRGGPDPDGCPLPASAMRTGGAGGVVLDTVYTPLETPLLRAARAEGWTCVDGAAMFVAQAAAQFEAWTGSPAPLGLFERVVRETLGRAEA